MSTPAMAFGTGLRSVLVSLWVMWCATFLVSRAFLLHDAYISESNKRVDEKWLLKKCSEPEFYSNIRQHTDLCTEVEKNARTSLFLTALNSVALQTHACGSLSCLDLVFTAFSKLGWHVALLLLALVVVAPNFIYMMLLQFQQHRRLKKPYAYSVMMDDDENNSKTHEANALMELRTQWVDQNLKKRSERRQDTVKLV